MSIGLSGSEKETVQQLRQLGEQAFLDLFESQRESLKRFVNVRIDRRLMRRMDASDVLQEAFFESSRRLEGYIADPQIPPTAWLRRIVRQVISRLKRDHLQTQCRDVRREAYVTTLAEVDIAELSQSLSSPLSKLQKVEFQERLAATLKTMSPFEREILILVHFEDRTVREAAAELDIGLEAAKKRYRRALARLRNLTESFATASTVQAVKARNS
jgi:RNA polymerase sigma-70 factor (ECF subfamily)